MKFFFQRFSHFEVSWRLKKNISRQLVVAADRINHRELLVLKKNLFAGSAKVARRKQERLRVLHVRFYGQNRDFL